MAAAALAARTAAQTACELAVQYAERRHHPPGGGDVNLRQLESALAKAKTKWASLETAQINYITKATFATDEERAEELRGWLDKETAHEDWVESIEATIRDLSAANNPVTPPALSPDQKLERLSASIKNKQASLVSMVDRIQTSLQDHTIRHTKPVLENYSRECDSVMGRLEGELAALHLEREQMDPLNWNTYGDGAHAFKEDLVARVCSLRTVIASRAPDGTGSGQPGGQSPTGAGGASQSCYKEYKRDDLPTYKGDIRGYPPFKREWTRLVAPGRSEDWQLQALQKRTPEEVDLTNCTTVAEAWQKLDDKYACPVTVSSVLVDSFINLKLKSKGDASKLVEIENKLETLYNDLLAVGEERQVSDNHYLLQVAVKKMPNKFQTKLADARAEKHEIPGETLWKILREFLKTQVQKIERYTPWELDEKEEKKFGKECYKCKSKDHETKNCPKHATKSTNAVIFEKEKTEVGRCPICQEYHTYWRRVSKAEVPSDRLTSCPVWRDQLTSAERAKKLQSVSGCANCTSWRHSRDNCNQRKVSCTVKEGSTVCGKMHHSKVHGTNVAYCNHVSIAYSSSVDIQEDAEEVSSPILLHMMEISFQNHINTVLFLDDGSTCSIITHKLAGWLGLKGREVEQWLEVAGKEYECFKTKLYTLRLRDRTGKVHCLSLMGMDKITSNPGRVDVREAYELFPHVPSGALDRPVGEVGLLIGQDYPWLLPTGGADENCKGGLRVMDTKFSSGFVLGGHHASFRHGGVKMTDEAKRVCYAIKAKKFVSGKQMNLINRLPNFLEAEELATEIPRRCERCVGCKQCSFQTQEMNRKQQEELRLMKKNVVHDADKRCVRVTYPIIGDVSKLRDNRYQVVRMAERYEKKLLKDGQLDNYNQVLQSYIDREVLVPVSDKDIQEWKEQGGHINYIGHHGVEKDASTTTPLRLVANSALKNCNTGPSVNDLWPKGPNSLSNLVEVLLRWRSYPVAVVWDLTKAYHSIFTSPTERYLRLIVWRFGKSGEDWLTWGFDRVAFGDIPASVFLEIVKDLAARLGADIDPDTARKIVEDSYVDDNLSGGNAEEADRMIGDCQEINGKFVYNGTVSQILSLVGLVPKVIIRSGEKDKEKIDKLGGRVLGHGWDPECDKISFTLTANIHERKRGIRTGPDLTFETLNTIETVQFTKRKILSLINGFFDPSGMISAYLIKFKIFMRTVTSYPDLDWDTPLPAQLQDIWRGLVREIVVAEQIVFPRGTKPASAVGRPEIIGYWDGSDVAYTAVVYIRWVLLGKTDDGERKWHVALLIAKARVTPAGGLSTPRSELNGFVVLGRLLDTVIKCLPVKPCRVTMIGDSECTISALDSPTASLAAYFANRLNEVEDNIKKWGTSTGYRQDG